jgi:general secretion pathway protein L
MSLRIFIPASGSFAEASLHWLLLDGRGQVQREGRSGFDGMPRGEPAQLVLPAERVLFARLALPRVNSSTIRELLPYAVEDRLLADPTHIHAVPGARNARGETLVAVVDRVWLRALLDAASANGIRVREAWCESALLAGGSRDWHVVLGPERGMLVDDDGVAATFDRGPGVPLALRVALDESSGRGERPESIALHAADGAALPDPSAWSGETGIPFTRGGAWEEIARGDRAQGTIELLHGDFAPQSAHRVRVPRAAVVLGILIVCAQIAFTGIDTLRLRREADALNARREAIFREAFPEARVVVDPDLQMARNLAELQRSRGLAQGDAFLAALTKASREASPPVKALDYQQGRATWK